MRGRFYNTSVVRFSTPKRCYSLCAYCGKEISTFTDYCDDDESAVYENCDCADANKQHELDVAIEKLKLSYPKERYYTESRSVLVDSEKCEKCDKIEIRGRMVL